LSLDLIHILLYRAPNPKRIRRVKIINANSLLTEAGPHKPLVGGSNPAAATFCCLASPIAANQLESAPLPFTV
jgi:hypothetical protein